MLALFLVALMMRLWVALAVPRTAHPDEIFQTEEPAHYLAYGNGILTWEWRDGVRSWVFPAFLAGVMRATSWMGPGSSGYLLGIKVILSLLSLTTIGFAFAFAQRESGNEAAIIAAGACALWFTMVDYGPRSLTEVVSTHVLLPGLYLGVYGEKIEERKRMFLAGLLCGLATCLRIQYVPAIGFALAYICYPAWKKRILPLTLGLLVPVAGFGLTDAITWSYPFSSFVRYFTFNFLQGQNANFGVFPWYWYLTTGLPQALGPLMIFAVIGWRRSPFLSWMALIILVSHSVIAHKEVRFLYLLWPIAITMAAMGTVDLAAAINARLKSPSLSPRFVVASSLSFSAIVLAGALTGFHYFGRTQGSMFLFDRLSRDSTVCGVGEVLLTWHDPGGYTHLHRNVPISYVRYLNDMDRASVGFNAMVTRGKLVQAPAGFVLESCQNDACLYRRPGTCAATGDFELGYRLKAVDR